MLKNLPNKTTIKALYHPGERALYLDAEFDEKIEAYMKFWLPSKGLAKDTKLVYTLSEK